MKFWYRRSLFAWLLSPLAIFFEIVVRVRRIAYKKNWLTSYRLPMPVLVVGNITVGGTGKTPFVVWLAVFLKERGFKPGIVSRGYKSNAPYYPYLVTKNANVNQVGDEALLIARHTACPMVIGVDRVAAARRLIENAQCDIIISDDGLQHYRLQRDLEFVVIDAKRGFGNGFMLPAGPLREPKSRQFESDFSIYNGGYADVRYPMKLIPTVLHRVHPLIDDTKIPVSDFVGKRVHAVAGIGNPQRFFTFLRDQGLDIIEHEYPDHYAYQASDIQFCDDYPVIMTEKDAVKCEKLSDNRHWYLGLYTELPEVFKDALILALTQCTKRYDQC